ncbi:LysR family transcriptional regulator [Clostridium sp. MSJ-4]|uniref:LysR family transcriptional regulator n=1 Tax=Clostridium simiarum TaxID=2841506 RepID=A0ABS6EZX4_9CLOT|nr:LysR family transcriptional regulator [Clostridium simiarum]MBU5591189.1 LysR family transcriptional regulator [Clostridium simiarum]
MNINYLISFLEVINHSNISKAASSLHMTQSALSQQLQTLEKMLDSQLMIRSNKGIELTEEGEIVESYAETLINIYENMLKELVNCKSSNLSNIKISSCSTVGQYLIPCTLYLYKKNKNDIKFDLKIEDSKKVINDVLDLSYDIGFIDGDVDIKGLECFRICNNDLVFIYSNERTIQKNSLSLEEICSLPLILPSEGTTSRELINALISIKNIKHINIEMELESIESIKASVIANHGVSIVPYTSVKNEIHSKVMQKATIIEQCTPCKISMIYQKKVASKPHIKDFISYIKKYGRETFC